jgi:hypothetical protein
MLYLIIGENDFLVKEKIKEITNGNYKLFSFKKNKEEDFYGEILNYINRRLFDINPFFIVINDLEKLDLKDSFISILKRANFILLLKKKNHQLIKKLKDSKINFEIIELENLKFKSEYSFKKFLEKYLKDKEINLPKEIIDIISKVFYQNPEYLINELKKIEYSSSLNLKKEDIINLIKWPNDSTIFNMLDDFLKKNYSSFILRLKREVYIGTKIENIIGLLFKTLLRILFLKNAKYKKNYDILNLNPYYLKKLQSYTYKFNDLEIIKMIKLLSDLDRKYKKFMIKENELIYEIAETLVTKKYE